MWACQIPLSGSRRRTSLSDPTSTTDCLDSDCAGTPCRSSLRSTASDVSLQGLDAAPLRHRGVTDDDRAGTHETIAADATITANRAVGREKGIRTNLTVVADADPRPDDDGLANR